MEPRKIALISHNDILGGAAIVTYRLMRELRAMGYDARMVVTKKISDDPYVIQAGNNPMRSYTFLKERAGIYLRNGHSRANLFKVSTADVGLPIWANSFVRDADAILINWVNQGTLSLHGVEILANSDRPVVWTMHDMWCMTGICHHSFGCEHFENVCGNCKFLGVKAGPDDLSHKVWEKKVRLYSMCPDLKFVAVSNWVKNRAIESSLLRDREVTVIHNAFPSDIFTTTAPNCGFFPATQFNRLIAFGAANLNDPVKGIKYAIDALNIVYDRYPEIAAGTCAVFFGEVNNPELFRHLKFPHVACGTIADTDTLRQLYCKSAVVLSTSLYETLGGTLIEGMSSGAVPVSFGVGGQTDIIDHKVNGYIARYLDAEDVAEGIRWAFQSGLKREDLHAIVAERFNARKIAEKYLRLIGFIK